MNSQQTSKITQAQAQTGLPLRRSARNTTRPDYREMNEYGNYINPRLLVAAPSKPALSGLTSPAEHIAAQVGGLFGLNDFPSAVGTSLTIRLARPATPGTQNLGLRSPVGLNSETNTASLASSAPTTRYALPLLRGLSSGDGNTNTTGDLMDLMQDSSVATESSLKREHEDADNSSIEHVGNDQKRLRTQVTNGFPTTPSSNGEPAIPGPIVWSNRRGGLCEALPYFNSYKGSLYTKDKVAFSFLIDSEIEQRDVFSAQVVITSLGGGRQPTTFDQVDGRTATVMVRRADALDSHFTVDAIRHALAEDRPIVIIAGQDHPLYPIEPPRPYAVLGYFRVTHFWKERQLNKLGQTVAVWRVRFEKAELDSISWWDPNGTHSCVASSVSSETCNSCSVASPTIFKNGWTCLNHECETYFGIIGPDDDNNALQYSDDFLNHRAPKAFDRPVAPLKPDMLDIQELMAGGSHGTDLRARAGFVCPKCGCANRHIYWSKLACENTHCGLEWPALMLPYPQEMRAREDVSFDQEIAKRRARHACADRLACMINNQVVLTMDTILGNYNARIYFLLSGLNGHICGSVVVLPAEAATNAALHGPEHLFRQLERTDMGLKRNPAAVPHHRLEGLTRHFQQNFGARYRFGVAVQSKGFDEAPEVILRGLHRLIWAANAAVAATANGLAGPGMPVGVSSPSATTPQFNELLALGYMDKDQIGYHDDGEHELGPTVGTLSLGSPSIMKFRPKKRAADFHGLPRYGRDGGLFQPVLEVPLRHGDMVVMHGTAIHSLYEHAVVPHGERRFSLTARHIDLDTLSPEDRELAVVQGKIPDSSWAYVYDGR